MRAWNMYVNISHAWFSTADSFHAHGKVRAVAVRATGVRVALLLDAEREVGVAGRAFVAELSPEPEAAVAHPGASVVCPRGSR